MLAVHSSTRAPLAARFGSLALNLLCLVPCALMLQGVLLQSGCAAQDKGTIGAVLAKSDEGRVFLREVPPDLAAGQAGLQVGDEVLLIDGIDVRQLEAKAIHDLLSGDVQQPIDLTLVRDEQVIRVTLQRTQSRRHRTDPAPSPETK